MLHMGGRIICPYTNKLNIIDFRKKNDKDYMISPLQISTVSY